jgi:predicted homoserine dehydrogenase-like protein
MIILDNLLKAREMADRPIRVGILGAGFMAQGLTNHITHSVPGMRVSAIYGRKVQRAIDIWTYTGFDGLDVATASSQSSFDNLVEWEDPVVTDDPSLLIHSPHIDVIVDATGAVEFGAKMLLEAFECGKDVVLMNAELDATIGPILQVYADKAGTILSAVEGDEPGIQVNLYRWVKGLGLTPRVIGSTKGLQDRYRNPDTQRGFAEKWKQNLYMITSAADGTKLNFEQAITANATGFVVQSQGMSRGIEYRDDVMKIGSLYDIEKLRELGGVIDYTVGTPHTKVFVLAEHPDPKQQRYLNLYHMGEGPLYTFFTPYHLVHFEMHNAIARVALLKDSVAKPLGGPVVEVAAVAKRNLNAGDILDDYGMFDTYGEAVNADEMCNKRLLPEGLVEGCKLKRSIMKDSTLTYDDIELPKGRLADTLRAEQYWHFRSEIWLKELVGGI